MSALMGFNARTGMEDNPYVVKGVPARSNAEFLEKLIRIASMLGRDIATPRQARQLLGISEIPTRY